MKIRIILVILAFCGFSNISAYSQGRIILLNGKEKPFRTAELKGELIEYMPPDSTRKVRKIDRYDVFSLMHDNGNEELIYNPDTVSGEDPTIEEAREYIKGEKYADLVYRKPLNFITGVAAGGAGSMIGFYGLIVPVVYPAVLGRFTPKVHTPVMHNFNAATGRFEPLSDPNATSNIAISESFSAGYGKKARNMKIKNSLIGGGIGFAVGFTVLVLVLSD